MQAYRELGAFLWGFVKRQKWLFFFIFLLDSLAWPSDSLLWPYILRLVIDVFTLYEENRWAAWGALQGPILAAVALIFFVEMSSRLMGFLMARALPRLQAEIRMALFDHIQHHRPHYFNERFAGSLANKVTDMTTQVETVIQELFFPLVPAVSTCFLATGVLYFVHPGLSLVLFFWIIIHLSICFRFTQRVDAYEHQHGEARSTLLGKIVDSFTNNFAVNLFYRFDYEKQLVGTYQELEEASNRRSKTYVEILHCFLSFFYIGASALVFGLLLWLWVSGVISSGEVV